MIFQETMSLYCDHSYTQYFTVELVESIEILILAQRKLHHFKFFCRPFALPNLYIPPIIKALKYNDNLRTLEFGMIAFKDKELSELVSQFSKVEIVIDKKLLH